MDMALVLAYGQPSPRPTYFSIAQYFTDRHSGKNAYNTLPALSG